MWVWIVAGCICYLLLGAITMGIVARITGELPTVCVGLSGTAMWPVLVVVGIIAFIISLVAGDVPTRPKAK